MGAQPLGSPSASTLSSWPLSQTLTSLATTRRIANKFPVIKLANEAVDPVRRRASRELPWCGERRKIAKNLHLSQRHQGTEKDIEKSWTPSGISLRDRGLWSAPQDRFPAICQKSRPDVFLGLFTGSHLKLPEYAPINGK